MPIPHHCAGFSHHGFFLAFQALCPYTASKGDHPMNYMPLAFLLLALASCFMYVEYKKKFVAAVALKASASFCFIVFGILSGSLASDSLFANPIIIGLILGGIADVLLNLRFVFEKHGKKLFLTGILFFLGGHILYVTALISRCDSLLPCILAGTLLTALVLAWLFSKITVGLTFKIFGIFYIGAIMLMNSIAAGVLLAFPSSFSVLFFIGALSFLVSDIVLILNTFGPRQQQNLRVVNLSLYYVGQLLIALSLQLLR